MSWLIDPPGPFSPTKELEDFLAEVRSLQEPAIKASIEMVEGYLKDALRRAVKCPRP
jgi:uncharacterized protein YjfI (DUF2170 family)